MGEGPGRDSLLCLLLDFNENGSRHLEMPSLPQEVRQEEEMSSLQRNVTLLLLRISGNRYFALKGLITV
jgi:hypothetical protein